MYPIHPRVIAGMLLAVGFTCALQAENAPRATLRTDAKNAPNTDPAHIDELIVQLGSSGYEDREAADDELREIGEAAIPVLALRFTQLDDYERCLRIQRIAEHIYFFSRVLGKNGFLGISHQEFRKSEFYQLGDARVPPDVAAFVVANVIPGTAAEKAGLKRGDVIVSVNGVTLPVSAEMTGFAKQIQDKRPGTEVIFEFWRGNDLITQPITIGYRPSQYYLASSTPEELRRQYTDAVKEFPQWWTSHFGPWSSRYASGADEQEYLAFPSRSDDDE